MTLLLNRRFFLVAGTMAIAYRRAFAAERPLDMALINARVWTGRRGERSDAIGIADNRIVAVDAKAVNAATGTCTRILERPR